MCRPYNRWLADYCRPYPDRLFGVAMPPMQSVDLAIDEVPYARQQLGMRGGFLRPNPYKDRMLHDPSYEPFWTMPSSSIFRSLFTRAQIPACPPLASTGSRTVRHATVSRTHGDLVAAMSVIWGGVCERHPRICLG
jgi:predicted TIM-barrel fold metal-dependent hydrolase